MTFKPTGTVTLLFSDIEDSTSAPAGPERRVCRCRLPKTLPATSPGVFFVPLAAIEDPALVLPAIAQSLAMVSAAGKDRIGC